MNLKNKKNLINILILLILVVALPLIIYLVRQQQDLRGKALGSPPIEFMGPAGSLVTLPGGKIGLKVTPGQAATVELRLTSPFGVPGSGSNQPTNTAQPTSQPTSVQPTTVQLTQAPTPTSSQQPSPTTTSSNPLSPTAVPVPTQVPSGTCFPYAQQFCEALNQCLFIWETCPPPTPSPTSPLSCSACTADLNSDGSVNSTDSDMANFCLTNYPTSPYTRSICAKLDLNTDNRIDQTEVSCVQSKLGQTCIQ